MATYRYPPTTSATSSPSQRRITPPDLTVDFARQMSINSEAEIAAALEQQAYHTHHHHRHRNPSGGDRCRRNLLDRRHSLAAMAPSLPASSSAAADGRLLHRRLNVGPIRSASASRSAEQLLPPARSRSPVSPSGGDQRVRTTSNPSPATTNPPPPVQQQHQKVQQHQRDRLSVSSNGEGARHHSHGRSQSVRTPKRPATASSATSSAAHQHPSQSTTLSGRPRGTSLPSHKATVKQTGSSAIGDQQQQQGDEGDEEAADYYLLRHFIVQQGSNRVVNRGDSFRRAANTRARASQHSSASSIR